LARGIEVDWVVVRINTIRRLVAIGLTLVVATGLLVLVNRHVHPTPDVAARRAIRRAEKAEERAGKVEIPANWKVELEQAARMLEDAREAYGDEDFSKAQKMALGARSRFEALAGAGDRSLVGEGQFHAVRGKVEIQRAGKSGWEIAEAEAPVFNGDFIKTGDNGSAEILFSDGTLFKVAPNSLLEIHRRGKTATGKEGTVKMVVGKINVVTGQSRSVIATEDLETRIDTDSRVSLNIEENTRETVISAFSGGATLRDAGGKEVQVGQREQVRTVPGTGFSEKRKIPPPPTPLEPMNNTGFDLAKDRVITLKWSKPPGSLGTRLQVSRFPDFPEGDLDVDSPVLRGGKVRLEALLPGNYFWRVATVFDDDALSEWSPPHRFRIYSRTRHRIIRDLEPPALSVEPIRQMGHICIVEGKTEPGSTIDINGSRAEVDVNGAFHKMVELHKVGWTAIVIRATDPSGNTTEARRKVYLEEF